jgi:hypothetical protein
MRVTMLVVGAGLLVGAATLHADQGQNGKGKGHPQAVSDNRAGVTGEVRVVFSTHDAQIIRTHYTPQYSNLPPGLRKKVARTGQLPPGWQKKMQPFPPTLERRLAPLPTGYSRGVLDGHAVIYSPGRSVILDATVLF